MLEQSSLQKFRELLPFYVNGTLDDSDHAFVRDLLTAHPVLQDELDFTESLRLATKAVGATRTKNEGLDRLLDAIRQQHQQLTWLQRFASRCRPLGLTPAFGVALVIILGQQWVLLSSGHQTAHPDTTVDFRTVDVPARNPDFKVTLKTSSVFAELVDLLRLCNVQISSGPSEGGELWLALNDRGQHNAVLTILRHSDLIIDVIPINP